MSAGTDEEKKHLPHHEQLPLCVTRLPYRQGRKLTAVKVYTVNNESNHLLIFGVPSVNLHQETKTLFLKFGKLLHFEVSTLHPAEEFTQTYHATYEKIQSARVAKKMLDTMNFYGGSLHVCYAPELETVKETRSKLLLRRRDVTFRLRNLLKEATEAEKNKQEKFKKDTEILNAKNTNIQNDLSVSNYEPIMNEVNYNTSNDCTSDVGTKLFMGEQNLICLNKNKHKLKSSKKVVIQKKFKPCFEESTEHFIKERENKESTQDFIKEREKKESTQHFIKESEKKENTQDFIKEREKKENTQDFIKESEKKESTQDFIKEREKKDSIEIVDCTSAEKEVISNINEGLNYNKFGNEIIKKVEEKPLNRIVFKCNKKS